MPLSTYAKLGDLWHYSVLRSRRILHVTEPVFPMVPGLQVQRVPRGSVANTSESVQNRFGAKTPETSMCSLVLVPNDGMSPVARWALNCGLQAFLLQCSRGKAVGEHRNAVTQSIAHIRGAPRSSCIGSSGPRRLHAHHGYQAILQQLEALSIGLPTNRNSADLVGTAVLSQTQRNEEELRGKMYIHVVATAGHEF